MATSSPPFSLFFNNMVALTFSMIQWFNHIIIKVCITGLGIPEENLERFDITADQYRNLVCDANEDGGGKFWSFSVGWRLTWWCFLQRKGSERLDINAGILFVIPMKMVIKMTMSTGGYCVNEMVKEGKLLRTSLGFVFWVYLEFYSVTFGVLCQSVEGWHDDVLCKGTVRLGGILKTSLLKKSTTSSPTLGLI